MLSFWKLSHILEQEEQSEIGVDSKKPLMTSGSEDIAKRAIRSGMQLRSKKDGDFWEDFIKVCGDSDSVAELLGVPKEKVSGWASHIREMIKEVTATDDHQESGKKYAKLLRTDQIDPGSDVAGALDTSAQADNRPTP